MRDLIMPDRIRSVIIVKDTIYPLKQFLFHVEIGKSFILFGFKKKRREMIIQRVC